MQTNIWRIYLRTCAMRPSQRKAVKFLRQPIAIRDTIIEAGGESEILGDLGGHPVVYGYFKAGANGNSEKTLLFYNHYDVQPEDPINEWKTRKAV